tara:strand:- start:2911 stop:3816 length:906 start_codon:yes stop_codon:yes gene_type:complete
MYFLQGFYKIKKINKLNFLHKKLKEKLISNFLTGTIIISSEGINGTIAGKTSSVLRCLSYIKKETAIKKFDSQNSSKCKFQPFNKAKVKIKNEIVPIGLKLNTKQKKKSNYINPKKWNKLISDKDITLIDVRKPFEYRVGTFVNAVNPKINSFREFPKYFNKLKKNKKIAMFCTGGIRCEKASNYLKKRGFNKIYQLKGGILNYLKEVKSKNSLWKGECFVFDRRVSIKHNLQQGSFTTCNGCRMPISLIEKKSKKFSEGISCPYCYDNLTNIQVERFTMRQKQILASKKIIKNNTNQKSI